MTPRFVMPRLAVALLALVISGCASSGGGANGWAGRRSEGARRETPRPLPPVAPPLAGHAPTPRAAPLPAPQTASGLLMPVVGFDPMALRDSFLSGRSGGRTHNSIDMAAPTGTPLVAVTDGTVTRMTWNALGGRTLYLRSADGRTDYYYAHMDSYAPGLAAPQAVRRGQALGTVGSTGNARGAHLHFQVLDVTAGGRGTPVNPFGLFRAAEMATAR